jgi:PAS domain S-box-containing protein
MLPADAGLAFVTFYPAVIASALLCGTGPALLATALSAVCADYFFLRPVWAAASGVHEMLALATFAFTGGLTCVFSYNLRSAIRELQASEQRLRGLYEAPHVGIALTDMQGRYLQFNEAFRTICGYSAQELQDLDYWALTPKKYAADEAKQLESLRCRGYYGPYEKEYVRKDGSVVPLQLNGALLKDSDGRAYIWSIVEDITERKWLERDLATESARNKMFLRTASDGVHILGAAGEVVEVSDSFCNMLGYRRDEVIGMRPSLWDVRLSESELCNVSSRVSAGELKRFVTRHRRKNGAIFDVEINADCFELDGEQYFYCSARDTTEQKRLERAVLETANREQAKLGHDLHDGLGQELAGISMLTSALAVSERRAGRPSADGLEQLEQLTRRTIATWGPLIFRAITYGRICR